ncbi:hypothetical protein RO3G_13956 [Rhizopus delemar RA 99-880]|uniref:Uncharacterized protein n=1 Tax=Rhizopus delemar (strain RA 99-880 / ATCC MYA-4621 / FGSC 9543 / NRRL 43880) TaxID=246409 RepID=I1CLB5_RHIO9|nr:hypothetical protein RO3G_13956 [Rhizopus delemar RA 99-880]|eukprot:EIE89245.1 hypothetical protein RO3G_13956 [Rhizopus delemar RA 99-880]
MKIVSILLLALFFYATLIFATHLTPLTKRTDSIPSRRKLKNSNGWIHKKRGPSGPSPCPYITCG